MPSRGTGLHRLRSWRAPEQLALASCWYPFGQENRVKHCTPIRMSTRSLPFAFHSPAALLQP